jgi:hypothetical protein
MEEVAEDHSMFPGSVKIVPGPNGSDSNVQHIDSKDLDLNLLIMAKNEYTTFLNAMLRNKIKEGLLTQYNTAVEESPSPNMIIRTYQRILKDTPLWNQNIVKKETKRVLGHNRAIFPNLLALLYVAKVKIMASVRVTRGTSYVALSMPSAEAFIHQVYIECAHILYENPTLCHLPSTDVYLHFHRNDVLNEVVKRGIEEALLAMLPINDILNEYLNHTMLNNSVFSMGEDHDEIDAKLASALDDEAPRSLRCQVSSSSSEEGERPLPVGDDFLTHPLSTEHSQDVKVVSTDPPPPPRTPEELPSMHLPLSPMPPVAEDEDDSTIPHDGRDQFESDSEIGDTAPATQDYNAGP